MPCFFVLTNPSDVFHSRLEFQICFISQKNTSMSEGELFMGMPENCPSHTALVACATLWVGLVCVLLASWSVSSPSTVLAAQLGGKNVRLFHLSCSVTCDKLRWLHLIFFQIFVETKWHWWYNNHAPNLPHDRYDQVHNTMLDSSTFHSCLPIQTYLMFWLWVLRTMYNM